MFYQGIIIIRAVLFKIFSIASVSSLYHSDDVAVPTQAPSNFTLVQVTSPNSALLSWNPVPNDTVRGHFKGYKVQTWTDQEGETGMREIHVKGDTTRALVNRFVPHTKNYARVLVFNSRYNGPPSETLSFDTPEGGTYTQALYTYY